MSYKTKIYSDIDHLTDQVQEWQAAGETVVFTNGVFDLLHLGHITYLEQAAELGQRLVIAVNADTSVRRLKGPQRPIHGSEMRLAMLASMTVVSAVITFEQDTPLQVIKTVKPDVLVKGGDYTVDQIVGAAEVQAYGGTVQQLSFVAGYSSTDIINKIRTADD